MVELDLSAYTPEEIANALEAVIAIEGKTHILERIELLMEEDYEPFLGLMFVYYTDKFAQSDEALLNQYLDWMAELLEEMQHGQE